jgi:riboflavin transporter FmnP
MKKNFDIFVINSAPKYISGFFIWRKFMEEKNVNNETKANVKILKYNSKTIAKIAILSALAFAVTFLEFPVIPAVPFLKLDFANLFIMLGGFIYGPVAAVIISFIKELLCLTKTTSGGIGEIANFVISFSYAFLPALIYKYRKGVKIVILMLACGCILQTATGLLMNRFVLLPLYVGNGANDYFKEMR